MRASVVAVAGIRGTSHDRRRLLDTPGTLRISLWTSPYNLHKTGDTMTQMQKTIASTAAALFLIVLHSTVEAGKGQHHPGGNCVCKGCDNGKDLYGKCEVVCFDKEVYAKGSESHDYCKK